MFANVNSNGNANRNSASNAWNSVLGFLLSPQRWIKEKEMLSLPLWRNKEVGRSTDDCRCVQISLLALPNCIPLMKGKLSMGEFDELLDLNHLYDSYKKSKKGCSWKGSVQLYEHDWLINIVKTRRMLEDHSYKPRKGREFTISERGKVRHIRSNPFFDRVIRRCFCDYILEKKLYPHLIHDNGASVTGKGMSFTQRRFEQKIHEYYRKYRSNEGYILKIDFKKYYDSIQHDKLLQEVTKYIDDPDVLWLVKVVLKNFETNGNRKSCGIGDQCSQIFGVFFLTAVDNHFKIVQRVRNYDRYMDDIIIVSNSKDSLRLYLQEALRLSTYLGLIINLKKTHIYKLSRGFTFLQRRYRLTRSGHLIRKVNPKCLAAIRRRLRKFASSNIPIRDVEESFKSWIGAFKKRLSKRSKRNLYRLYNELFIEPFVRGELYGCYAN